MAAEAKILTNKQKRQAVGAARKKPMKAAICSPYSVVWPPVTKADSVDILDLLRRELGTVELRKPSWIMRHDNINEYNVFKNLKAAERKERIVRLMEERTAENKNIMDQLVLGFQNVSKYLERDELRLVIGCKDSLFLIQHLVMLVGVRGCPGLVLSGLAYKLAHRLGVTKLSVMGFKKTQAGDSNHFDTLVREITPRCPPIKIPWLDLESDLLDLKHSEHTDRDDPTTASDIEESPITTHTEKPLTTAPDDSQDRDNKKSAKHTKVAQLHHSNSRSTSLPASEASSKFEQLDEVTEDTEKRTDQDPVEEFIDFVPIDNVSPEIKKRKRDQEKKDKKGNPKKFKKSKTPSNWEGMSVGKMVPNPNRKSNKKKL